jgi:hypothetical protein
MTCLLRCCLAVGYGSIFAADYRSLSGCGCRGSTRNADDAWVASMKAVHEKFKGKRGTFAQFGDSITVSRAFWFGLRYAPKNTSPEMARALDRVKGLHARGMLGLEGAGIRQPSRMTIRWADQNVDKWLQDLDPEVALMMFGTNDLGSLDLAEYETKTRQVVQKCLDNGTILILSTIAAQTRAGGEGRCLCRCVRRIAREMQLPLTDYHAEILKRRPDDWDGASDQFRQYQGYDVPTLIARDGVHPSNPQKYANDYSDEALHNNGFSLRNYLSAAEVRRGDRKGAREVTGFSRNVPAETQRVALTYQLALVSRGGWIVVSRWPSVFLPPSMTGWQGRAQGR